MKNLIPKAKKFAKKKHKGQKYSGGDFYRLHPYKVYKLIKQLRRKDYKLQAAALLHDTLEDTDTTYQELVEEFGEDVAKLVDEVTKRGSNYFPNLSTQKGVLLKFADRTCNINYMSDWSEEKKQRYMFVKSKFWRDNKDAPLAK